MKALLYHALHYLLIEKKGEENFFVIMDGGSIQSDDFLGCHFVALLVGPKPNQDGQQDLPVALKISDITDNDITSAALDPDNYSLLVVDIRRYLEAMGKVGKDAVKKVDDRLSADENKDNEKKREELIREIFVKEILAGDGLPIFQRYVPLSKVLSIATFKEEKWKM